MGDCLGQLAGLWDSWAADVRWRELAVRVIGVGGGAAIIVVGKRRDMDERITQGSD